MEVHRPAIGNILYLCGEGILSIGPLFVAYWFLIPLLHAFLGPSSLVIIVYFIDLVLCTC